MTKDNKRQEPKNQKARGDLSDLAAPRPASTLGSLVRTISFDEVVNSRSMGGPWVSAERSFFSTPEVLELQREINDLRQQITDNLNQLQTERKTREQSEAEAAKLKQDYETLKQKEELAFLLDRVTPRAHDVLLSNEAFRGKFSSSQECGAFVVSIDIRRSTELMLKARRPDLFAQFMTNICRNLQTLVKDNYGIFDKFTGDGILAFFPEFFSGGDAGYRAITAAQHAQSMFVTQYKDSRNFFTAILSEVGLGIGIDYGKVHVIPVAGGLTVVGAAVVYACRLGKAPAGKILLNQGAYERISEKYSSLCFLGETELDIKHEGRLLCYDLQLTNKPFTPTDPAWMARKGKASRAVSRGVGLK
jgi:class 3 adenylate cyclase